MGYLSVVAVPETGTNITFPHPNSTILQLDKNYNKNNAIGESALKYSRKIAMLPLL